jgi:retron-type reverse transcriptase
VASFGSVDHEKLLALVAQRVSDGRILRLIKAMLTAGSYGEGRLFPTERGTPQGGVASPLLSNILLTPFDREMRSRAIGSRGTRMTGSSPVHPRRRLEPRWRKRVRS